MSRIIVKIPKLNTPIKRVEPVLIELNKLVPHEDIVEGRLKDLVDKILGEKSVDMPLVVAPIPSSNNYLIVDGHHRWAALRELKCRFAPCVIIDYFDEEVKLKTWYPAVSGSLDTFFREALKYGLKMRDLGVLINVNDDFLSGFSFVIRGLDGRCIGINGGVEEQKIVSKILSDLNLKGFFTIVYYGELTDALRDLGSGEINYLFLRKTVTKEEVIDMVRKGKVYAPKTTRHILPFIPAKTYTELTKLCP